MFTNQIDPNCIPLVFWNYCQGFIDQKNKNHSLGIPFHFLFQLERCPQDLSLMEFPAAEALESPEASPVILTKHSPSKVAISIASQCFEMMF